MSSIDRIKRRRKEIELEQSNLMSTDKSLGRVGILRDEISSTGGLDYGANLEELAPVRKESWLKGGAFDDGYDFGDISKTIGGTIVDAGLGIAKGIAGVGESAGNLVVSGIAQVSDWFNNEEYANKLRNRISGKDEEYNNRKNNLMLSNILNKGQTAVDSSSVLGDKSDSVSEGLGYYMGMLAAQSVGVPWQVTSAATSMGNELTNAYANNATDTQAWFSAANSAAWEIASEYLSGGLKLPGTGKTVEAITGKFLDKMKSKTIKGLAGFGVNAISEGAEEIISSIGTALGQKISYMSDKEFKDLYNNKQAFDDFITGALVSGITMGVNPTTYKNIKTGRNLVTGYTANEQSVIDKEVENRINELEKNGNKISNKEKNNIEKQVKSDLEKGYISTDLIESLISGDTYQTLKDAQNKLDTINKQINELESKKMSDLNVGEWNSTKERLNALRESLSTIDTNSLRKNLDTEINEKIKSDELLKRSYQEKYNRSVKYDADVSKYNSKQQKTIQNAIDSGILNNTNKTHEFVNMIAKLSADKGIDFDFVNNAKLKDSGFSIDGKQVNGYVNENGITINIDSKNALNSIVGHEITHVLEGTKLYTELQNTIKDYATIKGIYNTKLAEITELYKNVDGAKIENELTSDLVGEYLFTDVDFVNKLSIEKPNIFKKIWEEIKYLYKIATANSKEARELEKVKRTFEEAYRQSDLVESNDNQVSYSISKNAKEDIEKVIKDITVRNPVLLRDYTPKSLVQNGVRDLPMYENPSHIRKNILTKQEAQKLGLIINKNDHYHGLGLDVYLKAIDSLDEPRVIFKRNNSNNYLILTTLKDNKGNNIIVPIEVETSTNVNNINIDTNRLKSVYGYDRINPNLNKYIKDNIKNIEFTKIYEQKKKPSTGKIPQSTSVANNIPQSSNNVNSDTSSTKYSMQKNTNDTQELDNSSFSLEQRVSGDALLDAQDFIDEVKSVGAEVDEKGYVTVYHQTSNENADKIRQSGKMIANEDYVYFSTSKDASQSEGRGQTKLEFKIPAEKLMLDDIFSDNADVKIPLKGKKTLDVSNYLVNDTKYSISDTDNKGRSLSNQNEIAPKNPNLTYGEDIKLKMLPTKEDISNLTKQVNNLSKQLEMSQKVKNEDITNEIAPFKNNKVMNPVEIANLRLEDANTTPQLTNKKYEKGDKTSKLYKNVTEKSQMLPETARTLLSNEENVKYYKNITNEESMDEALKKLQQNGSNETIRWVTQDSKSATATDVAEGWILLKQYSDNKDYDNMIEIAKKMRDIGTKAGQTVQAFNIMSRLTPEGMVKYAQSELIDAYNQMVKNKSQDWINKNMKDFDLTPGDVEFIMKTMKKVQSSARIRAACIISVA